MNAQGLFSIGGIASGLDTNDIVDQLMRLERQPVTRLQQRQANLNVTKEAWGQITTRLSTLRGAVDQLRRPDRFAAMTAVTSSDPQTVSVRRGTGSVDAAELSFTVERLASRMQQTSGDRFDGLDAALGTRSLVLADADGTEHDLTAGLGEDATLGDLIGAVNTAGIGVRASALQVAPGQYQLVLDATDTGAANAFSVVDDTGWGDEPGSSPFAVTQDAADALVRVGGIAVERSSNTITDLVEGAEITLNRTTDGPVTVRAERDLDAAVGAVRGLVDAVNATIGTIGDLTSFDPETREAGPLQGQFAATQLAFDLRNAVMAPVQGLTGADATASAVGLRSNRDGTISLDEDALRAALEEDFTGTTQRFARTGQASDPEVAGSVSASRATTAGTYEVELDPARSVARATGATYIPPGEGQPKSFMVIAPDGRVVTVRIDTDRQTAESARQAIQQALTDGGIGDLSVSVDGESLVMESVGVSDLDTTFTVAEIEADADGNPLLDAAGDYQRVAGGSVFGLEGEHRINVVGTINGEEIVGRGRLLTATEGPAAGLSVRIDALSQDPFEVSVWQGIGGALDAQLARAEGVGGSIARARSSLDSQISLFQSRIEQFEQRLESREITLRRQFVALETAMDRFNSQSTWLAGQLDQLTAINAQAARRR